MFEQVILDNNSEQIAKLYKPAKKAHEAPDTGVEILKKAAYFVIRDCAKLATEYLPLHVWMLYDDPLSQLKGKFTRADVEDFLKRSKDNTHATVLKKVIVSDIKDKYDVVQAPVQESQAVAIEIEEDDIYGSYDGYGEEEEVETPAINDQQDLSDDELIIKYLF